MARISVLQDQQALVARAHDDDHPVAGLLHPLGDRMQRRDADAAADADDVPNFSMCVGLAERAHQVLHLLAHLHFGREVRGLAHRLEDDGDAALARIGVGDGQRNALAEVGVELEDDELPRLPLLRDHLMAIRWSRSIQFACTGP
jgi:hypothetical protein